MEPRLSDLTREIANKSRMAGAIQYFWLLAKHGKNPGWLRNAADEFKRQRFASRDLDLVLMSAVEAGTTTSATWAQELAPYAGLTQEWVKSITAKTILGQLQYMRAPFRTKTIVDTSHGTAAWVEEGTPIPMSRLAFSATDQLDMKKVATIVPVTAELLELWTAAVQANLEDLIGRTVRYTLDRSLLDPDLSVTAARPASLTNGLSPTQSTGSSAAQALADFKALLTGPLTGTQDPSRVVIILAPTTALHLAQLLTASNTFAFPNLGALGGEIFGVRVLVSPAAAMLGSPSTNIVAAVDASRVIVADDSLMLVDVGSTASLSFTDNPSSPENQVSLFQTHTKALRITLYKNFLRANAIDREARELAAATPARARDCDVHKGGRVKAPPCSGRTPSPRVFAGALPQAGRRFFWRLPHDAVLRMSAFFTKLLGEMHGTRLMPLILCTY